MGRVLSFVDRLTNALTGTGTTRDARMANAYQARILTQPEIAAAYSASGLMRKIVRIPALDMVREWRDLTGLEDEQAAKVFDEEKRLGLRQKVLAAETMRGMGGGALILGLPGLPTEEAGPGGKGTLAFIHVVSRWHLSFDRLNDDATGPGFGEPAMWKLQTNDGQRDVHPSRVIPFRADQTAALALKASTDQDLFWGESVVQQVLEAVQDCDSAFAGFAALIHKARLLRIGIPRLMEISASAEGETQVMRRLSILAAAESIHNATIFDAGDGEGKGGEEITDATYSFAGARDMLNVYGERVAGISDIPATRLLGRAPEGMNASGDSQQEDWRKKVRAMQTLELGPCLDRVDRFLIPSAIGSTPPEAAYEFAPLDTESQEKRATRFKTLMEAGDKLGTMAVMPDTAFNRGMQSLLIEEGFLPELEAALADLPDDERYGISPKPGEDDGEEVIGASAGEGGDDEDAPPLRRAANDAAPRPLYVKRELLNAADLVAWAKSQGFDSTIPAGDMHVTVLYSRAAVDPIEMGEAWGTEADGTLIVKAGGPRALERFNEGAVVLQFASSGLSWRHEEMVRKGTSHDWPDYLPHVTITYEAPAELDLAAIKPFTGELRFGPEIFEPLDLDWKSKIEEA